MDSKTKKEVEQLDEFEPIELGSVSEETKGMGVQGFEAIDRPNSRPL